MKKLALLLLFYISFGITKAELIIPADSIRIVGYQYAFEHMKCEGRYNFMDHYFNGDTTAIDIEDFYVDYILGDALSIDTLLNLINDLEVCDTLPYSANELLWRGQYSQLTKTVSWVEPKCLDNVLLLIIFRKQNYEFVWLSEFELDKGYNRYFISDNLKTYLSRYSSAYR